MIEINLVPDIKQELLRAQRIRTTVISFSILVGIIVAAVVVLLLLWVFAVQGGRGLYYDTNITDRSGKLSNVADISNTLTIQNQLAQLSALHNAKNIDSRVFDILTTINPPAPNDIGITKASLDAASKTITIEAQAVNQYTALEMFEKTINATKFTYTQKGSGDGCQQNGTTETYTCSVPLASQLSNTSRSYGQSADGGMVLRFTLAFTYPEALFSRTVQDARIVAPSQTNATDSFLGVPNSLFTPKASDIQGGN
jgi:Tfp pilus assembly protein PilN